MVGMLIYNNILDRKAVNNKTENIEDKDNSESKIDLTGYTEVDITEQNMYPIYKRYEKNEHTFLIEENKEITGKFTIENNKLFFELNGTKNLINIENPQKAIIGAYGQDSSFTLFVLNGKGEIYTVNCITNYYHIYPTPTNLDSASIINEFVNYMNGNIMKNKEFSGISDISAIMRLYGQDGSEWEDVYFSYIKTDKEIINRTDFTGDPHIELEELKVGIGPVYIKNDGSVYDHYDNKLNIKPKYLLDYIPETGHGAFLDEDNYLYVSTYDENENIKKGKVTKVYESSNNNIIVKFANGTYKNLSEYENW